MIYRNPIPQKRGRRFIAVLTLLMLVMLCLPTTACAETESAVNRFNVMFVLDASVSMNETDARGLRYEAIRLFNSLLADQGNVLGGTVFSTGVDKVAEPRHVSGEQEKEAVVQDLMNVPYPGGWTNIGEGLSAALTNLEEKGDSALPSVIILLSDGNTAMYTESLAGDAVRLRDEAVATAAERAIPIYSICLNCNGTADPTEMQRISDDTGGVFTEVRSPEDLNKVFQVFYELIYGTHAVTLADGVFPPEGLLETPFEVPGFGVEEVNILIQGNARDITLTGPDGSSEPAEAVTNSSFTTLKLTELEPGDWTLHTRGVSGDRIQIELIYNTNLAVTLFMNQEGDELDPVEPVSFTAKLSAGEREAARQEDYAGFSAELIVFDETGEELRRLPMNIGRNGFEATSRFEAGTFSFEAEVSGRSLSRSSDRLGPVRFVSPERPDRTPDPSPTPQPTPETVANTAPVAITPSVRETVIIWPVVGGRYSLDLRTLVTDAEDTALNYTARSASFRESDEYRMSSAGQLTVTLGNFRLRGGSLVASASDSEGLSCSVSVTLRVINTVVILLALLAAGLIWLLIRLLLNRERPTPFRATVTVTTERDGVVRTSSPRTIQKNRKYHLSSFDNIEDIGLDYSRCWFEGGSDAFVFLITNRKVEWRGYLTDNVRIDSGTETSIIVDGNADRKMMIRYESENAALDEFLQDFEVS